MYSSESIAIFIDTTNIVILEGYLLDLLTTEMSENICWLYGKLASSVGKTVFFLLKRSAIWYSAEGLFNGDGSSRRNAKCTMVCTYNGNLV